MKHRKSRAAIAALTLCASIASAANADELAWKGRNDRLVDENGNVMVQSPLVSTGTAESPHVSFSESHGFGNTRFGAGYSIYSYAGTWAAPIAYASQSTSVYATAFDDKRTIVQQGIAAYTDASQAYANITDYVYALGYKVAGKDYSGGDYNGMYYLSSFSKQLYSASKTFWLSFVPITVSATVNAGAWHSIYGHFWHDGIEGQMGPGARATVTASAGVGVSGFQAGLRGKDLSLLNVSLSHSPKARYTNRWGADGVCRADFSRGSRLDLVLSTLSGRLQIFAEVFWQSLSDDIANWKGPTKSYVLLNYPSYTYQHYSPTCLSVGAAPQFQGIIVG